MNKANHTGKSYFLGGERVTKLFIAIGVHKAQGMPLLDGVLKGIDDLTSWAQSCKYDVIKIDDRVERVDIARIRDCLMPLDGSNRSSAILLDRSRIIVYFCGHGLHAPADQYWILSAGPKQPKERISAVGFRDTLATYGSKQIAFISDACRSLQQVIGQGDCIVDAYEAEVGPQQKDIFFSSRDGAASFAVPAKNGTPAYCVFSQALHRALTQPDPNKKNLDKFYLVLGRRVVTSQSLADYLETHVPEAALEVGKIQVPQCDTGFRYAINDYTEFVDSTVPNSEIVLSLPTINTEEFAIYSTHLSLVRQNDRVDRSRSEWRAPFVEEIQNFISHRTRAINSRFGPFLVVSDQLPILIGKRTYKRFDIWRSSLNHGTAIGHWFWKPNGFFETDNSNVLIAKIGGLYSPVILFKKLWCAITLKDDFQQHDDSTGMGGINMLTWGDLYSRAPVSGSSSRGELHATEVLKGLSEGTLNSGDIRLFINQMRCGKHFDPMLGIVSAHLYNGIGDIENIRRMCFYYHDNDQDVPFDIAMLAGVPLERNAERKCFTITIPKVEETPEADRYEDAPDFTWKSTRSVNVNVAGVTPILRVGWQYISGSKHRIHQKCSELVDHLTEAPIATLSGNEVGEALIQAFKEF